MIEKTHIYFGCSISAYDALRRQYIQYVKLGDHISIIQFLCFLVRRFFCVNVWNMYFWIFQHSALQDELRHLRQVSTSLWVFQNYVLILHWDSNLWIWKTPVSSDLKHDSQVTTHFFPCNILIWLLSIKNEIFKCSESTRSLSRIQCNDNHI